MEKISEQKIEEREKSELFSNELLCAVIKIVSCWGAAEITKIAMNKIYFFNLLLIQLIE